MDIFDNPITRLAVGIALAVVFFSLLLTFLPVVALPSAFSTAFVTLFSSFVEWSFVLPVGVILYCFAVSLTLEFTILTVKIFIAVARFVNKFR